MTDFNEKETMTNGIGVNIFGRLNQHEVMLMKEAGIKWIRIDLVWSNIEKEKGIYNFTGTGYDQLVNLLTKYGIKPYFILDYSNKIYEKELLSITTSEGRRAFTEFVRVAVQRYKGKGAIWEIWNEPNLSHYWSTQPNINDYTLLVFDVAPVIKGLDYTGKVVAPALSGVRGDSLLWLEDTFKLGILDYIDAVSVHPYRSTNPETVVCDYDAIKLSIMKYTKKRVPIISGEWGYYFINADNIKNKDLKQAQYLIRMLLVNFWKSIPISIIYEWKNNVEESNNIHNDFGIMWNQYKPKESYYAIKTLTKVLSGHFFVKRIDIGQSNDYILIFTNKAGNQVIVFWTSADFSHSINIRFPSGKGKLISIFGKEEEIKWNQNKMQFHLTSSPSYLIIE